MSKVGQAWIVDQGQWRAALGDLVRRNYPNMLNSLLSGFGIKPITGSMTSMIEGDGTGRIEERINPCHPQGHQHLHAPTGAMFRWHRLPRIRL